MKTIMFSLTFVVAIVLYGAGFFVPETQGIENIVDGHIVLNDAEMAQLVGGPTRFTREKIIDGNNAQPPDCEALAIKDCKRTVHEYVLLPKYTCVDCGTKHDSQQYAEENNSPANIEYYCTINKAGKCITEDQVIRYHYNVCTRDLETTCRHYPPVSGNSQGNYW